MTSLTLSIPEELKHKMASFKYINWSAIARQAIINKIELLERMNRLLSKSTLTEEDTVRIGSVIKKKQWARARKLLK